MMLLQPELEHENGHYGFLHFVVPFAPHVVFFLFILLSAGSASTVTRVAFWSWLTLVICDELLPRITLSSRLGVEYFGAAFSGANVKKAAIVLFILFLVTQTRLGSGATFGGREFVCLGLTTGFLGAIFAIPIAHELMHSNSGSDRRWAVVVMAMFSYPHFCLEHMHGHHRNVGTYDDPATARFGESIYAFLGRTLHRSLVNSWDREIVRLDVLKKRKWSMSNRVLTYFAGVVVIHCLVLIAFGMQGDVFFLIQGIAGVLTLEAVNYIEHYGLQRRRNERGAYEPVGHDHSWNSGHLLTNLLLFDLARHSDHHINSRRQFRNLELSREATQLPVGYFGILWLTLFPPLWRQLMDTRIQQRRGLDVLRRKEDLRMKTCRMCLKEDLDDKAKRCPHCGSWQSPWRRRIGAVIGGLSIGTLAILAVVIVVGLALCSG